MKKLAIALTVLMVFSAFPLIMTSDSADGVTVDMDNRLVTNVYVKEIPGGFSSYYTSSNDNSRSFARAFNSGSAEHMNFKTALDAGLDVLNMSEGSTPWNIIYVFTSSPDILVNLNYSSSSSFTVGEEYLYKKPSGEVMKAPTFKLYSGQTVTITLADEPPSSVYFGKRYDTGWGYYSFDGVKIDSKVVSFTPDQAIDYMFYNYSGGSSGGEMYLEYSLHYEEISDNGTIIGYIGLGIGIACIVVLFLLGKPEKL